MFGFVSKMTMKIWSQSLSSPLSKIFNFMTPRGNTVTFCEESVHWFVVVQSLTTLKLFKGMEDIFYGEMISKDPYAVTVSFSESS